jgi:hypothetical protein
MEWVPDDGWFSYLRVDAAARDLVYDLSVGTAGTSPSFVATGLTRFEPNTRQLRGFGLEPTDDSPWRGWWPAAAVGLALAGGAGAAAGLIVSRRAARRAATCP